MPDEKPARLSARNVTVAYGGVVANDDVSLTVGSGEIVGLIGPNGAGKTTFVDAVTGFTEYSGEITLGDTRLDGRAPHLRRRAGLSRTWQSGELFGNLTVAQNVVAALRPGGPATLWRDLFGRRKTGTDELVASTLHAVGLGDLGETTARDLTLGQQKLVGVARALVGNCRLLLLDEPAAGLDSQESLDFAERIRAVARGGPGVLLIDHDMSLILGVCDRIYVMEFGKVIFSGTPEEARKDPAVIAAYLGTPMETTHG
ncbi:MULTISPECIES: ABC transporter ATP-binding protein [Rhodococcus]|uniref:ABC transporter ATP-binding protein n=1 Tax=Rhodococcus coprophilus TaxID=38310 RepID=A0A2X4TP77_9NOCA|nr:MULTISPECIES: ABC transporter ATP-binding protein [Rhodococcus]MBF0662674.1 ABC transporter ATP-binding protein [Rhodococcus sp. (in: high G+C Gram-positive bacteria)]MBM7461399.1 ABC-type branched-subunit amino acid transport system ATPase component [Rhodococcus coprophilus]NMD95256.1 ABC transporter ATP-binding protein [Rhodococcus sp. BL-253-APC-6A1W]NME79863.1 ABC transporter ATP-binding protein [Rhodococcus sp. 105337]SQI29377.1 ABC transporter ATP-binding protein [Rhodococcus coprophi